MTGTRSRVRRHGQTLIAVGPALLVGLLAVLGMETPLRPVELGWPLSLVPPAAVLAATTLAAALSDRPIWGEVVFVGFTVVLAWVFGDAVARRRAVRQEVEREPTARRECNDLRTRVAAVRERLRISCELHQLDPPVPWKPVECRGVRQPGGSRHLSLALDGCLAGAILALALWSTLGVPAGQGPPTPWTVALVAVMTVPLVLRRRLPELVTTLVVAATATQLLIGMPINDGMVAVAVALHAIAVRSRSRAVVAGALSVGVLVAIVAWSDAGAAALLGLGLGPFVAVALHIGEADRAAAAHNIMLHRRFAEAEEDGRLRVRAAVVDQRAAAARDLHDSVGHTISLILLLCGAARLSVGSAAESLTAIECSAARAVFCIIQEALTNVMKHAAGGAATVHVEWVGRRVRVRVADTGGTGDRLLLPSGSRGLAGMRERVALFGGYLSAGPGGGGFVVDARIPVASARSRTLPKRCRRDHPRADRRTSRCPG